MAAADEVRAATVGILGFCMGGMYALMAACRLAVTESIGAWSMSASWNAISRPLSTVWSFCCRLTPM